MTLDLAFDFRKLSTQGAYFSTYTPSSLSDYLQQPVIPKMSRYHLVGTSPPLLQILNKINILHIVHQYLTSSNSLNTIIDLCLPYHHPQHHQPYLGRYILWKGKLIAIRLCTTKYRLFDAWTHRKSKILQFKIDQRQMNNIMVGQFSLNFNNFRIGLMFDQQLSTICNQYINCRFDSFFLVNLERNPDAQTQAKKLQLSMQVLLIETKPVVKFQKIDLINLKELFINRTIYQTSKIVTIDYYQFDKLFANKLRSQINQNNIQVLPSLEIPFFLSQIQQNEHIKTKIGKYSFTSSQFASQLILQHKFKKPQIKKYLGSILSFLQFSQGSKIILFIQENPSTICLLFILKQILQEISYPNSNHLDSLFISLSSGSKQLNYLLERIDIINLQSLQSIQQKNNQTLQNLLLHKLDSITHQHPKQEWFAIITTNPTLKNVIQLINKRNPLSENIYQSTFLQTWLALEFLSSAQLTELYHSHQIREFVGNDDYWKEIWLNTQPNPSRKSNQIDQLIDQYINRSEINYQLQRQQLDCLLRTHNAIIHQFLLWIKQNNHPTHQIQSLFPHFLFRTIKTINPSSHPSEYQPTLTQQLLTLPKPKLIHLFSLTKTANYSSLHQLYLSLTIRSIGYTINKHKCHSCQNFLERELLFSCKRKYCDEYYCYKCLIFNFGYQSEYLINSKRANLQPFIKICPSCQGSCSQQCQPCKLISIRNNRAKPNFNNQSCHYCHCSNHHLITCSTQFCRQTICINCLLKIEQYQYQSIDNTNNWICQSCKNKCYCNLCQINKQQNNAKHISNLELFNFRKTNSFNNNQIEFNLKNKTIQKSSNFQKLINDNPEQHALISTPNTINPTSEILFPTKHQSPTIQKHKQYQDQTNLSRPALSKKNHQLSQN